MTHAEVPADSGTRNHSDEEEVHDGTDALATDVSDDIDSDMIRDDYQNEDH